MLPKDDLNQFLLFLKIIKSGHAFKEEGIRSFIKKE
jgi:hypothetical protein